MVKLAPRNLHQSLQLCAKQARRPTRRQQLPIKPAPPGNAWTISIRPIFLERQLNPFVTGSASFISSIIIEQSITSFSMRNSIVAKLLQCRACRGLLFKKGNAAPRDFAIRETSTSRLFFLKGEDSPTRYPDDGSK